MANTKKKAPTVKPIVTRNRDVVPITAEQAKKFFPKAWKQAIEDHKANIECAKEDGDWDPKEPGILHPKDCAWSLHRFNQGLIPDSPYYKDKLPGFPGYVLHMYDEEAIASYHGGGSDMAWTGDEWEM